MLDVGSGSDRAHASAEIRPPRRSATRNGRWPTITNLHRVHAFLVVASELNFRRAATRLQMTQSPLSRTIKALEDELGVTLFERTRHHVRLTSAGESFFADATALLEHAEATTNRLRPRSETAE